MLATIFLLLIAFHSTAQLSTGTIWYSMADFGAARQAPVSFSIGNRGYVGTGFGGDYMSDFWEYDPATNTWSQKANFGGGGRMRAVGFSIGSKGYIGTGRNASSLNNADFWEYDPSSNAWTQKANFAGDARNLAVGFSIGSKGYLGTGQSSAANYTNDFWEYDPSSNTWTQKANFGGVARRGAVGFSIASKGYIGTGTDGAFKNDFWEYDPSSNTWTQKANYGGTARHMAMGAGASSVGYIVGGVENIEKFDVWEYKPSTNAWTSKQAYGSRQQGTAFTINEILYVGLGVSNGIINSTFRRHTPYWEVRNSTGDYDEQAMTGSPTCYQYPLQYTGTWRGYVECPADNSGCFVGFAVNTLQNLGNFCYRSRVEAGPSLRTRYGWAGGSRQENVLLCRRNYQMSFQNQPVSPVGFELYYTKSEIDNLINTFNTTYGTNKTYSDLVIVKYNGANQDLDPTNNSNNSSDYQKIIPSITFYGNTGQYAYTEFNVSSYSEFYLALTGPSTRYVNDNSLTGNLFTTNVGNNSNNGSPAFPYATIQYAVSQAHEGDTIYVDAGTYVEQVTIDKGITIIGAGKTLSLVQIPLSGVIPPPGPFIEKGVIQTAQNIGDVHISKLSVTSDPTVATPIILQSGGSVKNCRVQNGNQGIFFRVESGAKTALIEDNYINAEYIGINVQGSGMTAIILTNEIAVVNQGFSAGIFAGLDFGPLPQFLVIGNIISNFSNYGLLANSNSSNISQNSIVGTGGFAIQQFSGNQLNANCNWFGSQEAEYIRPRISGNINYTPWLVSGVDNEPGTMGLQTVPGTCTGRQNKFYVNDNVQAGDVLTTAVGNNANNGFSSAPFATIDFALTRAQAGDTIFVDAGVYAMANFTINKSITILGSNYSISPNNASNKVQYNTSRNAEAQITGSTWTMGADWILINGLRFTSNTPIALSADFSHIKFDKNFFDVAGTASTVSLQGISSAPIVAFDFSITDNRFERTDNLTGNSIFLGAVKNLWIDNNVILESGVQTFRATGLRTSNTLSVQNVLFSNNYLKKLNNAVASFILQISFITNNQFDSCNLGVNLSPGNMISNSVTIGGNTFLNCRTARSILVRGGAGGGINNLSIINNTINQNVDGINGIVSIIQLEFAAANTFGAALVTGNIVNISGDYNNNGIGTNCGILLAGKHVNTNITGNELNFSAINARVGLSPGILPPVPAGIFINTDGAAQNGLIPASAVININNNKINGFKQSVVFYDPLPGLTPEIGYGYLTPGATVNINNNSLTGDSISIDNGTTSQLVNATCNWYGGAGAETVMPRVKGPVTFTPWLTSGTDNDLVATGFQPAAGFCNGRQNKFYVNDNSLTGDVFTTAVGNNSNNGLPSAPFATLDYAYNIAQAGDTVFADAGVYNLGASNYTISKPIAFLGTNYQVTPNDPSNKILLNPARNAEAVISNGTIMLGSNGIYFEGFTIDMGDRTAMRLNNSVGTNNDFGTFRFAKNILKITNTTAGLNQFSFTGKFVSTPALPITSGYTITDNRFEKSGDAAGNTLTFSYVKNITIDDNSFVVTGTTLRTQSVTSLGSTGIVDGFIFSNNRIEEANGVIGASRLAGAIISSNKMHNVNGPLSNTNPMSESSNIEFSNNEVGNDLGTPFMLYNRSGVSTAGATNVLKVENNIFTGVSVAGLNQLFATMNFTFSNTVLNPSFIIRGNTINYSGDFSAVASQFFRPITVRGNIANVTLENNELILNNSGGLGAVVPATLLPANPAFSIITDNGTTSFMPSNAVINVLNNKISGYKQSVVFYDVAAGGHDAYSGYGNVPAGANINIHNNSFTGDSISINNGAIGQTVNATCNWYGSAAAQNVIPKIFANTVTYSPWLTSGIDTDVATGFQPAGGTCSGTPVVVTLDNTTDVTCFGANNGIINVTISGGTIPYIIEWTKDGNAFASSEDLSNLAPATYHLTVTDVNGSVAQLEIGISEPQLLTASADGTHVNCYGESNGSASVTAEGGTVSYTYLWSNGATTDAITNLAAGVYSVTVTDANGCTVVTEFTVTQPALLTATATATSTSCFNSITVVAGGGTSPYSYLWSNGATTATINSIPSGTYSVTITDAHGCTATTSAIVTANEAFNPSAAATNASCYGGSNGSITVTNVNAVPPFQYSIDGGLNFQPGNVFSGLAAGTYTITVKDANGCTGFVTKTVDQPTQLVTVLNSVQSSCFGASTGSINLSVSGGSPSYGYQWTGPNSYSSSQLNISNLAPGNYVFTVTDSRGCTLVRNITVPSFNQVVVASTVNNILCKGETNGTIQLTVTGGSGSGFTYLWNNGATTNNIINLGVGNYNVTITDAGSGCVVTRSFTITQPSSIVSISANKSNATGCNSLGTISATASGGTGSYQYKLNSGNYQSSGSFTGLYAGSYTVWVKDANGCTKSTVVSITDSGSDEYESNNSKNQARAIGIGPDIFARLALSNDVDWFKFTTPVGNTSYTVTLTHPTISYSFAVYPSANNAPPLVPASSTPTSKTYSLLGNSTYYINVTGSLSFVCYDLRVSSGLFTRGNVELEEETNIVVVPEKLSVLAYPNPHSGSFNLRIASPETGIARVELFTVNGQKLADKKVVVQKGENNAAPFTGIPQGTIIYRVQVGKYVVNGKVIGIE
jgi:hypothetical protein